jgi:hypothetical protein
LRGTEKDARDPLAKIWVAEDSVTRKATPVNTARCSLVNLAIVPNKWSGGEMIPILPTPASVDRKFAFDGKRQLSPFAKRSRYSPGFSLLSIMSGDILISVQ